ncbi:hypothetical protein K402DRAFT_414880 [Aulographum hederae CBS 113979]|uniref:Heterokaryon incompatibility domain-containing protein n=1 Tax=Aulographum hederae CBS 113979 TaxID=1176131 RepID=A0A6G1GNY1_9PEZI|nr:hypothetical protein K402DRAFT_414880 [Aulographum hederae CBS 113979]
MYINSLQEGSLRLLELQPGQKEDPIICKLQEVSLKDAEDKYEAISYVWGDPNVTSGILCEGVKCQITISLALALQTFRHAFQIRILWADAVCINQCDDQEKGHQVKQMGNVYMKAKRVLVHLGLDNENIAGDCFQLIKDFNGFWGSELHRYKDPREIRTRASYPFSMNIKRWEAVVKMSKISWFARLWVVQEAGLAKSCTAFWGHADIEFSQIIETFLWLQGRADLSQRLCSGADWKWFDIFLGNQCTLGNTTTWRKDLPLCTFYSDHHLTNPADLTLIRVLQTGRSMKASDPRDHVYGFLGNPLALTKDGGVMVEPNYTKSNSVGDVCCDIAIALLHHSREAQYLFGAVDHECLSNVLAEDGCPSWAPRWDRGYWTISLTAPAYWYYAGGSKDTFDVKMTGNLLLCLECIEFDQLSWVSEHLSQGNLGIDATEWDAVFRTSRQSPIEHTWKTILSSCHYFTSEFEHAFKTTLFREYPRDQVQTESIHQSRAGADFSDYKDLMQKIVEASCAADVAESSSVRVARLAAQVANCRNRRLAHTEGGRLVLTPRFAKAGDKCCVVPGVPTPLILRPSVKEGVYHLVGDCYIYGAMRGEIIKMAEAGKYQSRTIHLK